MNLTRKDAQRYIEFVKKLKSLNFESEDLDRVARLLKVREADIAELAESDVILELDY